MMTQVEMLDLLAAMLKCHGPVGDEREIDAFLLREFAATGAKTWQDGMSNIYAHVTGDGPRVMVVVHKDELGFIVSQVLEDGSLKAQDLGMSQPWKYGEGPVDIIADDGSIVPAVLSFGSTHTRSGPVGEFRQGSRSPNWGDVTLFTGLERDTLLQRGVHIGSRGVVSHERKALMHLPGDHVGGFGLDDRVCMVSLIDALRQFAETPGGPDLYFVASTAEESGYLGATRAGQVLRPDIVVALDISPLSPDTPTAFDARPVIWYTESDGSYSSKPDCDTLLRLGNELGFGAQPIVFTSLASDAGGMQRIGLADRTLAFGPAILNSHGFEIVKTDAVANVTRLLVAYLRQL
ncbi:MAG: hypothetical protein OXF44_05350 [Anaerolineaceae bacterium]|nr:hypothetical protein [Anaerolineaceae bacterium]